MHKVDPAPNRPLRFVVTGRQLVINADDFGLAPGVNRGIAEAHEHGVVTSTSLMVFEPFAADAARLAQDLPELGVGLHAVLTENGAGTRRGELDRQIDRFVELVGCPPTHVDSHHHVHLDPHLLPDVLDGARRLGVPLRGHAGVPCIMAFYGGPGGGCHPEQLTAMGLLAIVDREAGDGCSEVCCHPAYVDDHLVSSYRAEREAELRALCNPALHEGLTERGFDLVSFAAASGRPSR